MAYFTEDSKTVKLPKAYLTEKGVTVKGSKIYLVENGITSLLWSGEITGMYVVGGSGSAIATSKDGVTWNLITGNFKVGSTVYSDAIITDLAYGNGVLVAAVEGIVSARRLYYSTDKGQTWTYAGVAGTFSIAFGNGRFVAVSESSYIYPMYSVDGKTWTSSTVKKIGVLNAPLRFVGDKFIVISANANGAAKTYASSDGINWSIGTGISAYGVYAVAYCFDKYFLFGKSVAAYSLNGYTWTLLDTPSLAGLGQIYSVASSDSIIALAGYYSSSQNAAWYVDSDDGTIKAGSGIVLNATSSYQRMIYHDKFVFATINSILAYSKDGKNWTKQTLGTSIAYRGLCFVPDEE